ncbi:putative DNA-directed RNA polymerase beta subunit [Erwinia phage vB_EamM_Phobos]|uniref:RNA polymerase beta subunit n=1 Tax=Erwinia phage vB_EamM_Phobos TaxID=1883377 RepID=UPI00081C9A8B|nr:RNA polymerase beta subunit [Erwinia phage vB_EamM_Phobos]ANZ50226.1 putative DNA-directed RNA polymerase beta subunit [Erwinia phage vB_EamM_Phobos]
MQSYTEFKSTTADRETNSDAISGARAAMVGGHMKSAVPLDSPEATLHFTGADTEYEKYVFNHVVEDQGEVYQYSLAGRHLRAIFTRTSSRQDSTPLQRAIFFRRSALGDGGRPVVDVIETTGFTDHDHVFTSLQKETPKLQRLLRGETNVLEYGEDITELNCQLNGEFVDGVNLVTVPISHPENIEDAYLISKTAAAMMHGYGYRRIVVPMRDGDVLLDIMGSRSSDGRWIPKYFPDVGDAIRNDGLVIAKRQYDPLYAAIDMSSGELQHPSPFYDSCEYVDADPDYMANPNDENGSRVIDIKVWRNDSMVKGANNNIRCTEENKRILDEYAFGLKDYYASILRFYFSVKEDVVWSPKANLLIRTALASDCHEVFREFQRDIRDELTKSVRRHENKPDYVDNAMKKIQDAPERGLKEAITNYTIEIVVRYPIPVTVSSKITDRSGTKGIVGAVLDDDKMPVDEFGMTIHCLRSANAIKRRSTYAAPYHIFWSAASEQLKIRMKPMLEADKVEEAWALLMEYLDCYNDKWRQAIELTHQTREKQIELFEEIYRTSIRIHLPHELNKSRLDICDDLGEFAPKRTKLLMTDYRGRKKWTKNTFYVGYVETLRLDKTGREFSSMSSMYTNYLGAIDASGAGAGNYPMKYKAIKFGGESERRLLEGYRKGAFDEIHNRANSPDVHRAVVRGLYTSHTPTSPGYLIDRSEYPMGYSQIDKLVENIHRCEGFRLVRPRREDATV